MSRSRAITPALLLLALAAATDRASAAWPHVANNGNVPLCTAAGNQSIPTIIPDGAGGAIATWHDSRNGAADVYAQRISATGMALWTANGVALCTAAADQFNPKIVPDGAGGAIVTWQDHRGGATADIYAQRINAAGAAQWAGDGVVLCTAAGDQSEPTIIPDGAGGAIVAWYDYRGGPTADIYAQGISAAGATQWTGDGVALCTASGDQLSPTIASDGTGGAIVAWYDLRSGTDYDIYAQRISAGGTAQWTVDGVALSTAWDAQTFPTIAPDGTGGAVVTWQDFRGGVTYDIYAQRINAAGVALWTASGVALCTTGGDQYGPTIGSDGAGGAIVTWYDSRGGANYDIYAQRVGAAGVPLWTASGVALSTAAGHQYSPTIISDGAGGAIVAWYDYRSGATADIYVQRVGAAGVPLWMADGAALCTTAGEQYIPTIGSDGAGGAIVSWADSRSGTSYDIYAQRIERYGQLGNPEPVIARVQDVPNDQGGFVKLSWDASYLDADPLYGVYEYRLFRSAPGALAARAAVPGAVTEDSDVAVREGALLAAPRAGAPVYWEYVGTQAAEAFAGYSRVLATTSDSIAAGNPHTLFMVEARAATALSAARWSSTPDSGYSVDNLPPALPAPFTGQYAAGTASLHWNPNPEADLAGYRLYRGTAAGFVPGPATLLAALPDTGYADPAGAPYVYKLTAIDMHGNESPVATLNLSGVLDVDPAAPRALSFAPPHPNPARGATTLAFTLSRAGPVRLAVYDAAGRRVRVLHDGALPAGPHRERVTLRDAAGRAFASGLYLVRLEAEGQVLTRRLAAIR
jgi:hypothetical protein